MTPAGRLSLVSGDPLPQIEVAGSEVVYLAPISGNCTSIWDGSAWVEFSYVGELTLTLTAGAHLLGKGYDVFEFDDGGTVKLGSGPAWASNTLRSAAVEVFHGRMVNAAAITLTNGISTYSVGAREANVRGGFRCHANGQTRSTLASRLVWDLLRPAVMPVRKADATDSWSYSGASFRQARGDATNQIEVFNGVSGQPVDVTVWGYVIGTSGTPRSGFVGIGLDSSTVDSGHVKVPCAGSNAFPVLPGFSRFAGHVGIGYHELRWLERGAGAEAQNWVGDNGYGGYGYQTGLIGQVVQ